MKNQKEKKKRYKASFGIVAFFEAEDEMAVDEILASSELKAISIPGVGKMTGYAFQNQSIKIKRIKGGMCGENP